jgi:hypothetical protein
MEYISPVWTFVKCWKPKIEIVVSFTGADVRDSHDDERKREGETQVRKVLAR